MATVDGALSPPPDTDAANSSFPLSAKRKRDESIEAQNHTNGISDSKNTIASAPLTPEESQAFIRGLIDVLKGHDTTPSILNRPLPDHASSDEPQAKRHKAEGTADHNTILTRQSENSYSTIEEVLDDIDLIVSDITEKLHLPSAANHPVPSSLSQTETSLKIAAFKRRAHQLVHREKRAKEQNVPGGTNGDVSSLSTINGIDGGLSTNRQVLTLYGSAGPQSKQLFSSLQLPTRVAGENEDIVQPLRESGLPNGITTTQIVPILSTGLKDDKKRVPTLGELFPTPTTVPQLQPPKPSKIAVTRSSPVGWYQPGSVNLLPKNGTYFRQTISTGHWLDYSNASPTPGSKRKQRDRALSLGAAKAPQVDADPIESESTKLDNLFRSAYSSFAPCKDDAAAVIPGGMLDRIWWQHIGEKSFERLVQNANILDVVVDSEVNNDQSRTEGEDEEEMFREAVENFAGPVDPNLESVVKAADEKDVDEILEEISDLLRTLNSHQRNRHLNLNSSRSSGLLNGPDTTSLGTPLKPSDPEISIYEILKSQLTLMIATLPPYAIAKLDSDQLAELAISTKIEIRLEDHQGVMEEDEASARAKALAFSAASATRPVPQPQHRPSSAALYGNQYAAPRPTPQAQHQYYGQGQTPVRPPSNNMQRPPATAQVPYQSQRPAAAAPFRPGSYGAQTYQSPRPQQSYTPQPQYQQTPLANYNRPAGQTYQGAPQSAPPAAMNPRYQGQPAYTQQAPAQNGIGYQYGNGVNAIQQVSPQKPMHSPQAAYNQAQPRPAYSTPTPPVAPDRRTYLQNPMAPQMLNGGSTPSHQQQSVPQPPLGPTNYQTFMTTEQQSSMMERQRAQLAQQQGLQQQIARNAAQAGTLGSPSKSQVNGNALTAGQ
ncbi:hypothetical protein D0Z07_7244 [Hyphodiscus hymeniophilus]|uniref:Uncharacterized protein n=1 Tax=Hyphodiscus hymeniophilus TaxID=353542 RepID=A0A9P6VGB3_9HELO|nr:hypothetical protein D0Z07_7244 [Hyphodiscus hymeniophilus]